MNTTWQQFRRLMFARLKQAVNAVAAWSAALLLAGIHRCDRVVVSNIAGAVMRTVGPWLPEHRTGRANLRAAFPDKSDADIEAILRGVWDNLGRVAAEIAHLDHICSGDPYKRTYIDYTPDNIGCLLIADLATILVDGLARPD